METFALFVFYLNVESIAYTFRKASLLHIKKHYFIRFFAYFPLCLNDIHREKLFYSIQYKNAWLAAFDLFEMFTQ